MGGAGGTRSSPGTNHTTPGSSDSSSVTRSLLFAQYTAGSMHVMEPENPGTECCVVPSEHESVVTPLPVLTVTWSRDVDTHETW